MGRGAGSANDPRARALSKEGRADQDHGVTQRSTRIAGWRAGALGAAAIAWGALGAAPPDLNLELVGAMPARAASVVAFRDASAWRSGEGARALEGFATEFGLWTRTREAWENLARALRWTSEEATDALLGRQAAVVFGADEGAETPGAPGTMGSMALVCGVRGEVRERIVEALRASPNAIVGGHVVLSVEQGAYRLAASGHRDGEARVVLAPSGAEGLLESLLGVLPKEDGRAPEADSFASRAWWPKAAALGGGDVLYVARGREEEPETFFALSARSEARGWNAAFVGCDGGTAHEDDGASAEERVWPGGVIAALEPGALLLAAGSPREGAGVHREAGLGPRTARAIVPSLLAMLGLPAAAREQFGAVGVVAFGEAKGSVVGTAVVRVRDVEVFRDVVDPWLRRDAGGRPGELGAVTDVRLGAMSAGGVGRYLRGGGAGGAIAWCYEAGEGAASRMELGEKVAGWWIVTLRTGEDQTAAAREGVARIRAALGATLGAREGDERREFHLVVKPDALREAMRETDGGTVGALRALRWIERVETTIEGGDGGGFAGRMRVVGNARAVGEKEEAAPAREK